MAQCTGAQCWVQQGCPPQHTQVQLIILRKALQRVALSSTLDSAALPASAPVCLDRLVELQEMGCRSGMTGALWGWTALSQGGSARHAVLPTTATICCTLWIRACPDCWSTKGYDAMLGCLPSASVDHASLARHSCLQASSVLFWLWLTLATGGQCCPGQPGTALLQAAHSLQVFAADCAAAVRCSPAVTGVSASEWAVWPHASAAACVSVCSADGAACVPASPKAHLQLVDNWSPAVAWHTPGHPTCPVSLLFCCAQSGAPISSPVPCSMALPVLHTPRVLYCSWTAMQRLVSGPHPGRCTHWILPALQLGGRTSFAPDRVAILCHVSRSWTAMQRCQDLLAPDLVAT